MEEIKAAFSIYDGQPQETRHIVMRTNRRLFPLLVNILALHQSLYVYLGMVEKIRSSMTWTTLQMLVIWR